jgi:integrase
MSWSMLSVASSAGSSPISPGSSRVKTLKFRSCDRARWEEPKKENPTLREFYKEYIDYYKANRRRRSTERHETSWTSIEPFFGKKRLGEIKAIDIERYRHKRQDEGRRPATINRELYNVAIRWGKATENPVREVKFTRENNQRIRFLTYEEEERLLAACIPQLKPIVMTALHTGFRRSEILSLTWDDVSFDRRSVTVQAGYAKNGESRTIPMNESLRRTLEQIKMPDGAVFRNRSGIPFDANRVREHGEAGGD